MWFFGKKNISIKPRSYVQIRMEAIGGQGAHSAGKILAEAAVLGCDYTGNHFSSFGSEKRGTPVKSFVRFSTEQKPMRSASFIREPDLLVIFHEQMIATHPEVFSGMGSNTDLIVNSKKDPHELVFPKGVHPRWVSTLNATRISQQTKGGLNAVMLGAMSTFLPEIQFEKIEKVLLQIFPNSAKAFETGRDSLKVKTERPNQDRMEVSHESKIRLGYQNAPIGGVILDGGNSVLKNQEASRKGFAPLLNVDQCCNCGYCDQVCPDFCFEFKPSNLNPHGVQMVKLHYEFCKGCQKCIEVCPVEALTLTPEDLIDKD